MAQLSHSLFYKLKTINKNNKKNKHLDHLIMNISHVGQYSLKINIYDS